MEKGAEAKEAQALLLKWSLRTQTQVTGPPDLSSAVRC